MCPASRLRVPRHWEGINDNHDILVAEDRTYQEGQLPPVRRFKFVSPGFFETIGASLVVGRDITWADVQTSRPVAVIAENLAREMWGAPTNALGKRIRHHPRSPWREVVGVVRDIYEDGVHQKPSATVYWPILMENFWDTRFGIQRSAAFTIRSTRAGTESFVKEVQEGVWSVNASLPVAQIRTLEEVYERALARTSFTLVMLAIGAGMALLLGIIGIYAVISYAVTQQTREIGIRAALGAQHGELKRMFVRAGVALAGAGIVLGLSVAVVLTRVMASLLFGVQPIDPLTYVAVSCVLIVSAVVASYVPARRAARFDPLVALRYE